jgi:hypothetical protein
MCSPGDRVPQLPSDAGRADGVVTVEPGCPVPLTGIGMEQLTLGLLQGRPLEHHFLLAPLRDSDDE